MLSHPLNGERSCIFDGAAEAVLDTLVGCLALRLLEAGWDDPCKHPVDCADADALLGFWQSYAENWFARLGIRSCCRDIELLAELGQGMFLDVSAEDARKLREQLSRRGALPDLTPQCQPELPLAPGRVASASPLSGLAGLASFLAGGGRAVLVFLGGPGRSTWLAGLEEHAWPTFASMLGFGSNRALSLYASSLFPEEDLRENPFSMLCAPARRREELFAFACAVRRSRGLEEVICMEGAEVLGVPTGPAGGAGTRRHRGSFSVQLLEEHFSGTPEGRFSLARIEKATPVSLASASEELKLDAERLRWLLTACVAEGKDFGTVWSTWDLYLPACSAAMLFNIAACLQAA